MHVLHGVEVPGGDHDEVTGDGFGLDHRARGALGLARDGELAFLDGRHQLLLGPDVERVDLVDEQHALVGLVDRARFDAVVARRLHAAGLEGVVADVTEQCAGVGTGRVLEGCDALIAVVDDHVGHHCIRATRGVAEDQPDDPCCENAKQDLSAYQKRIPDDDGNNDPHQNRSHLVALAGFFLVGVDDLFALSGGNGSDLRLVAVVGIVVD